jgi:hypothetical protein
MESKKKSSAKNGCVSPDIREAAERISKKRGEDLDAIVANFVTKYVLDNLSLLYAEKEGDDQCLK